MYTKILVFFCIKYKPVIVYRFVYDAFFFNPVFLAHSPEKLELAFETYSKKNVYKKKPCHNLSQYVVK